ncbi:hypothetical protein ACFQY4_26475 [Catellatospora bangladeshensis]|uniref:DUF7669 domain-containing protein n=1 Tax=Catellatospora bangladeshensis TaxID=310355 RepID=A0A8J3JRX6_9ACTN|nr:hypothetical protein [Catellatospora bangladeshensis]GIF85891.1 hypothetical protein Cba03nite_72400 [Catellatospora bangladeshensis]
MRAWLSVDVWQAVAQELAHHRNAGLGDLLTEDVVRFASARALVAAGVDPAQLRYEWPHPDLKGSRIDLVVGAGMPGALVEFKFPREPNEVNAAWTMALGEVLKDFYRLAVYSATADRVFVLAETDRLGRYLASSGKRYGFDFSAEDIVLDPAVLERLPSSAAQIIGQRMAGLQVTARRLLSTVIGPRLRLTAFIVDPVHVAGKMTRLPVQRPEHTSSSSRVSQSARSLLDTNRSTLDTNRSTGGVRAEILDAVAAVMVRSGAATFTLTDVLTEMRRRATRYAESTIRTMISSHMCVNAPDNASTTYEDFVRVDRATYQLNPRQAGSP